MAESYPNRQKTLWEKEKFLFTSNFSFSHSVFKGPVLQTRENQGLFGKGLMRSKTKQQIAINRHYILKHWLWSFFPDVDCPSVKCLYLSFTWIQKLFSWSWFLCLILLHLFSCVLLSTKESSRPLTSSQSVNQSINQMDQSTDRPIDQSINE